MIKGLEHNKLIKPSKHESPVKVIVCEDLDIELIKKQRLSQELKEELIQKNQKNKLENNKELIFYTDRSLKKSATENSTETDRMGIGWVQVDSEEEEVIDEGTIGARNWPSSTKAELFTIWYVLLIMPRKRKVKIYTDSAAAIAGLGKSKKLNSSSHWNKEKNYNLKRSIFELLKLKELELDLVKVKGHSCNKWNDRADKLAKEGVN